MPLLDPLCSGSNILQSSPSLSPTSSHTHDYSTVLTKHSSSPNQGTWLGKSKSADLRNGEIKEHSCERPKSPGSSEISEPEEVFSSSFVDDTEICTPQVTHPSCLLGPAPFWPLGLYS